jgi:hypothetical protein
LRGVFFESRGSGRHHQQCSPPRGCREWSSFQRIGAPETVLLVLVAVLGKVLYTVLQQRQCNRPVSMLKSRPFCMLFQCLCLRIVPFVALHRTSKQTPSRYIYPRRGWLPITQITLTARHGLLRNHLLAFAQLSTQGHELKLLSNSIRAYFLL